MRVALIVLTLLSGRWLGAGTVEMLRADAELELAAARSEALATVAADPRSAEAVAAAAWWLDRHEFLAEPAELHAVVGANADPELAFLVDQLDAALHHQAPSSVLARAVVSGPFGSFDTLDLERWTMPSDTELPALSTPWRSETRPFRLVLHRGDGWIVPPSAMLRSGVYLAAWSLDVPGDWDGWLVVEADGGFVMEVDGARIDSQRGCGEVSAAVHWYRASLRPGRHVVRLAFASPRTPRVRLALYDDRSRPAPHLQAEPALSADELSGSSVVPAEPAAFQSVAEAEASDLASHLTAALVAKARRDGLREGAFLAHAAGAVASDQMSALVAVQRAAWRLESWTGEDSGTDQREARRLLAADSGLPMAVLYRRVLNLRQQRLDDAEDDLDTLIERAGHDPRVVSMWLDHALSNGWAAEAEATLERLVRAIPDSPTLIRRRLEVLEALDRFSERRHLLVELAASEPFYPGLVEELVASCQDRVALEVLERRQATGIEELAVDLGQLQLLVETGQLRAAEQALQRCRSRWGNVAILDRFAIELAAVEGDDAVRRVARQAVERSPYRLELWELLWRLGEEPFFEPFAVDALELARAFEGDESDIDSILILDQAVERVFPDGSSLYYYHGLSRAVTPAGARQAAELPLLPESVLLAVRIIRPDGTVVVPANLRAADPGVLLEDVEPGDLVEQRYVAPVRPARSARGGHLSPYIYRFAASDRAFGLSEYVLLSEPDVALEIDGNLEGVEREERIEGALRVVRYFTDQVPPIPPEPFAPPAQELLPWVTYGFGVTWQDVGDSIRDRVLDAMTGSPELWAWSERVLGGDDPPIEALQRTVMSLLERVDRGEGTFTFGRTAGESFSEGEGNRLAIAAAALDRSGWKVDLVLTRPMALAGSHLEVPTLEAFGLAVLRLERDGQELWLDVEEEGQGVNRLRPLVQGSDGLLLPLSEPGEPVRLIDRLPEFANPGLRERVQLDARVQSDGDALFEFEIQLSGGSGERLAEALRTAPLDRVSMIYERLAGSFFPGVEEVDGHLDDRGESPILQLTGRVPEACEADGDELTCRRLVLPQALAPRLATLPERQFPLVLQLPLLRTWTMTLTMPFDVEVVSASRRFSSQWGSVDEDLRVESNTVRSTLDLAIPAQVVSPQRYPEFARFCHAVDELILRPLAIRPVASGS